MAIHERTANRQEDLEANEAVNVIGRVSSSNLDCINMIGADRLSNLLKGIM